MREVLQLRQIFGINGTLEPDLNNENIPSFEELSENTIKQALLVSLFHANTTPMYHVKCYQSRMVKLASPMVGLAEQFKFEF